MSTLRARPRASSSASTRPASTVLPMPTSSAIRRRTRSRPSAISSGTSWNSVGIARLRCRPTMGAEPWTSASWCARRRRSCSMASVVTSGEGYGNCPSSTRSTAAANRRECRSRPSSGVAVNSPSARASTRQSRSRKRTTRPGASSWVGCIRRVATRLDARLRDSRRRSSRRMSRRTRSARCGRRGGIGAAWSPYRRTQRAGRRIRYAVGSLEPSSSSSHSGGISARPSRHRSTTAVWNHSRAKSAWSSARI